MSSKKISEEDGISNSNIPNNNIGSGKIAGAGVGEYGEPGIKKKKKLFDILKRNIKK